MNKLKRFAIAAAAAATVVVIMVPALAVGFVVGLAWVAGRQGFRFSVGALTKPFPGPAAAPAPE